MLRLVHCITTFLTCTTFLTLQYNRQSFFHCDKYFRGVAQASLVSDKPGQRRRLQEVPMVQNTSRTNSSFFNFDHNTSSNSTNQNATESSSQRSFPIKFEIQGTCRVSNDLSSMLVKLLFCWAIAALIAPFISLRYSVIVSS